MRFSRLAPLAAFGVLASSMIAACGGTTGTGPNLATAGDGGTTAPVIVSPDYPAPHAPLPQVDFNGGGVMAAVKVVTVTFDGDSLRQTLESFGDTIAESSWWTAVSAGYCSPSGSTNCIGKGSTSVHVHLSAQPAASYDDSSQGGSSGMTQFLAAHVADGSLPAPDANTLYVLYFPDTTTITLDGTQSCAVGGFSGYHKSAAVTPPGGSQVSAVYAVVPRCTLEGKTLDEAVTFSASHEIIEAATDPFVTDNAVGYYLMDPAWNLLGGEVADLCLDLAGEGLDTTTENGFTVQRSWSNESARASHNPCVPIPQGEVYFNLAPELAPSGQSSAYVQLAVGESATFDAMAFSDGPIDNWTLKGIDFAALSGGTASLSFAFDTTVANNGTKVKVTVTLNKDAQTNASLQGGGLVKVEPFFLESKLTTDAGAKTIRLWPGLVIQK
jgi:hypothetical protein